MGIKIVDKFKIWYKVELTSITDWLDVEGKAGERVSNGSQTEWITVAPLEWEREVGENHEDRNLLNWYARGGTWKVVKYQGS